MEDLVFALLNYNNNLNEAVGLQIDSTGKLIEDIGGTNCLIEGIYVDIIPHHGAEGDIVIDYIHKYIK
jgi:hypothetical protein